LAASCNFAGAELSRDLLLSLGLVGWFVVLAMAEVVTASANPVREESGGDARLVTNFGLTALVLVAGGLYPLANVASAAAGERWGVGLAQRLALPWLSIFTLALLAQTFAAYWVHRWMHRTPLFWRVHRVHHADSAVDVSTSLRNHPFELLVTLPVSSLVVLATGAGVSVVVAVQTVIVAGALWQHADVQLPPRLDRALALVLVTPRLHRLHHNPVRPVHDSNYGDLFTLWDWQFGTLNLSEGRGPVGLDDQAARADHLLDQIRAPLHA
jgi:sterol desaturase/sphingolipid hydroxylase (fatty acid hydroxylase superfamily)